MGRRTQGEHQMMTEISTQHADATKTPNRELLALDGIGKVFVTDEIETHALAGVQLSVRSGEWLAIVGPSGSGKTTLLAILGLLESPSTGDYRLAGRSVSGLSVMERASIRNQNVGFIFQT